MCLGLPAQQLLHDRYLLMFSPSVLLWVSEGEGEGRNLFLSLSLCHSICRAGGWSN